MPAPRPTFLPGPENGATHDEQARLAANAQGALESVGMDTEQVPTSLGPPPKVQMTREADPAQLDVARGAADGQVAQAKTQAAAGIDADHGLGTIYPARTNERLSARRRLMGVRRPPAGGTSQSAPADIAAGLDQSLGPRFRGRLGAERDKYSAGERRFDADSAQAHHDADAEIARLTAQTAREQLAERQKANADVAAYQQEWRTELDQGEQDYAKKATDAARKQRAEIDVKRAEAESNAAAKFDEAEVKASEKTREAERNANEEKARKREESHGFWGWLKGAASALIDGLKAALNAIYDGLRWAVKGLFKLAKEAAMLIINAVRFIIAGLIKAFGVILKGFVSLALIAFPKIAKKINDKIDRAVDFAVEKVNTAADKLKGAVAAVLDFVASTIDKLLGLVQSLYNGLLTVIGMLIRGELRELIERLGNVVKAAKASPSHFEAAAYSVLLGNVHDPLSPKELEQAHIKPPQAAGARTGAPPASGQAGTRPATSLSGSNVGVDEVVEGAELSPQVTEELARAIAGRGEVLIGESSSPDRTVAAMMAEAGSRQPGPEGEGEQAEVKYPDDGLSPRQRAEIRWTLMKQGLSHWWQENKVKVIIGAVAAILALAALIFFSGGTILAAIGPIMEVLGPLFIGATIATIAGHVEKFVTKAWNGDIDGGARSLADALANGAIELITWLTFKAGGAAIRGAKALAKAGSRFRTALTAATGAAGRLAARGAGFVIERGKLLLNGIKGFVLKQYTRLREMGAALLERLRFRGLRIISRDRFWVLQGLINPWEDIAFWPKSGLKEVGTGPAPYAELSLRARALVTAEQFERLAVLGRTRGMGDDDILAFVERLSTMSEEEQRFVLSSDKKLADALAAESAVGKVSDKPAESPGAEEGRQTAAERDWEKAQAEAERQRAEADKPEATEHGAIRQQERGKLTSAEKARLGESLPRLQPDGNTTRILREGRGKYTVVTTNTQNEIVTVIRGKTPEELRGFSIEHQWDPPWE